MQFFIASSYAIFIASSYAIFIASSYAIFIASSYAIFIASSYDLQSSILIMYVDSRNYSTCWRTFYTNIFIVMAIMNSPSMV